MRDINSDIKQLGSTFDDAAGEAFDKIARILGLPFPGGPHLDRLAREGDRDAIDFPRGMTLFADEQERGAKEFSFSFSGLKSAVARWIEKNPQLTDSERANVAASFQEAVVDVLTAKAFAACKRTGIDRLLIAGGVAANSRLRALASERAERAGVTLTIPTPDLCTDNGAMVAALGALAVRAGIAPSALALDVEPGLPIAAASN